MAEQYRVDWILVLTEAWNVFRDSKLYSLPSVDEFKDGRRRNQLNLQIGR
jgi:hypothetical protein